MSSAQSALRYVAAAKTSSLGTLYLHCYVKPGAAKAREGVTGLTEDAIEICVAAQPREGQANKAVLRLLSEASPSEVAQSRAARHLTQRLTRDRYSSFQGQTFRLSRVRTADTRRLL
ncbi:conserved hypothetical protein [Verticillium alfalfae VaMs.102]|uniref:YggU family protein n=1 Tax=Verticillium alfalfae (strain VaMs.102 / ATCC MYA-4576 / FGSC 10136) TaxID=526221 RepID=C9SDY5_VERA1|nr:conserved hypothetical protein [Verticillium alfalfae VaMs.102]EEY17232.1 conserved hypothetical protein [Verticillium alfalfae VaMs.102]